MMPPRFQTVLKSRPWSTCLGSSTLPPDGEKTSRHAAYGSLKTTVKRLGPATRIVATRSQGVRVASRFAGSIIVFQVKTASALVTGTPSDQAARLRIRKVTENGRSVSVPSRVFGTSSARTGTYRKSLV